VNRLRSALLTVGAIFGSLCLLLALAGVLFGVKPLVFRSGSMSPDIPTGSLALARPVAATDLEVGDVVSVVNAAGVRVTHRVVAIAGTGPARELTLRGDANPVPDAETYPVTSVDRVHLSVPGVGYAVAWLGSPLGLLVLGGACVGVLVLGFTGGRPRPPRGGRRRAGAVAAPVVAAALVVQASTGTLAAWNDTASVTGPSVAAYAVPKPVRVSCTVTGGALAQKTATIVFSEAALAGTSLDYTALIAETGQAMTVTDNGATRQVQFSAGLLSTVLNTTYNIRITARLPAPNGGWVSAYLNQPVTITLLGLGMTCGTPS